MKKIYISKTQQRNQRTINTAPFKLTFSTWDLCMNFVSTVNQSRTLMQAQCLGKTVVLFPEGKPVSLVRKELSSNHGTVVPCEA